MHRISKRKIHSKVTVRISTQCFCYFKAQSNGTKPFNSTKITAGINCEKEFLEMGPVMAQKLKMMMVVVFLLLPKCWGYTIKTDLL